MDVLIIRDGGATKVPRTVADMAEVESLRAPGFAVDVLGGEEPAASVPPVAVKTTKPAAKKTAKPAKA